MYGMRGYDELRPAKQPPGTSGAQKLQVVFEGDDYLKCHPFLSDGMTPNTHIDLYVMKPWSFRRTLWDATGPDHGGVSYVYITSGHRTASMDVSPGNTVTEDQKITPDYNDGDVIYAESGSETFMLTNGETTQLSDVNRDGRAWAHLGG